MNRARTQGEGEVKVPSVKVLLVIEGGKEGRKLFDDARFHDDAVLTLTVGKEI